MKIAKRILGTAALILLTGTLCACAGKVPEIPDRTTEEDVDMIDAIKLGRGMNIQGPDGERIPGYMTSEKTYRLISEKGFDHVRLPANFRAFLDEDGKLKEEDMAEYDKAVAYALKYDLAVMVDFHSWYDLNTALPGEEEKFLSIWRQLSERYAGKSEKILFELINEPHTTEGGNLDAENLNRLQYKAFDIIREKNPKRVIVAASADWNGAWTLKDLRLPSDDKNIIVAVHNYAPLKFTHQGATWGDPTNTEQVRLKKSMLLEFDEQMKDVEAYVKKSGRIVILNEFGVYQTVADHDDTYEYLSHVIDKCSEIGIPWTYWEFNRGMGAYERNLFGGGKWRDYITDALLK